jgi:hypothetical protein
MFGDPKKMSKMIIDKQYAATQLAGGGEVDEHEGNAQALHAAAGDVMGAIHSKDTEGLAMALHSFHEVCDTMPHKEASHEDEGE